MKKLIVLFMALPLLSYAQEKGVQFQHGLSFAQVKAKAKKENKYIFVDCSTTWCGWCKKMVAEVFPQEKVGDFFNKNFVSVEVQMDQTDKDNDYVKSWRPDAKGFEQYVSAYPTYLVFSPNGLIVNRIVGYSEADAFIEKAKKSLDPQTQYFTLLRKYEAGDKKPDFLYTLATNALDDGDSKNADKIAKDYLATQTNLYTEKNLKFIARTAKSTKSKAFDMMVNDAAKVDAVLGKGQAEAVAARVVMSEEVYSKLSRTGSNIDSVATAATAKYPKVDLSESLSMLKIEIYQSTKDWNKFQPAVLAYMDKYGANVQPQVLNQFAWTVFQSCEDPDCVAKAMEWSKRSVDSTNSKDPALLDTYANLLHKLGKTKDAIAVEEQALAMVGESDKASYQATLDKMKNGEKTW